MGGTGRRARMPVVTRSSCMGIGIPLPIPLKFLPSIAHRGNLPREHRPTERL